MRMLKQKQSLGHEELYTSFRKGLRNGNWRKLRFLDKALFRAAMGYAKAVAMLDKGEENFEGVFVWAPRVKDWLKDPDYIFWLGTNLFLNPFASKSLYGKTLRGKKSFTNNFFYLR
jgi:hypothetical protein